MLSNSLNRFRMGAVLALTFVAFIALVGCSEMPTSAEAPEGPTLLKRNLVAYRGLDEGVYTEQIVSAGEGGVVTLLDVELHFPPKALDNDTLISISIPDPAVFFNDFGTNGLQFNVPVMVVMSYRDADLSGIDENTIKIAWHNDYNDTWDIIDCTINPFDKTVVGFVSHFSAYALITDE